MVKKILTGFIATGLLFFLFSCQRELDFDPGNDPGQGPGPGQPTVNDSIYISQYTELDTTESSGMDTTYKYTFAYDAQKRITAIKEYNFWPSATVPDELTVEKYFYNGNDTLPYKMILVKTDVANVIIYTDTVYYTFDNNGFVKSDSSRSEYAGVLTVRATYFTALPGGKYKLTGSRVMADSVIVTPTKVNGNTTGEEVMIYNIGGVSTSSDLVFKYNDKPDPFYRIALHYPTLYNFAAPYFTNSQKNNLIESDDLSSSWPEHYLNYYESRPDGYPLVIRWYNVGTPTDAGKGIYTYIHL